MLFIASCICRRGPRGTVSVSPTSGLRGAGSQPAYPINYCPVSPQLGWLTPFFPVSGRGCAGCRCSRVLPNLPRAPAGGPQLFQKHLVAQSIHALPETAVAVCAQLPFLRQPLHRFALPNRSVAFNVINHFGLKHEEAAVDPT